MAVASLTNAADTWEPMMLTTSAHRIVTVLSLTLTIVMMT